MALFHIIHASNVQSLFLLVTFCKCFWGRLSYRYGCWSSNREGKQWHIATSSWQPRPSDQSGFRELKPRKSRELTRRSVGWASILVMSILAYKKQVIVFFANIIINKLLIKWDPSTWQCVYGCVSPWLESCVRKGRKYREYSILCVLFHYCWGLLRGGVYNLT